MNPNNLTPEQLMKLLMSGQFHLVPANQSEPNKLSEDHKIGDLTDILSQQVKMYINTIPQLLAQGRIHDTMDVVDELKESLIFVERLNNYVQ